MLVCHMKLNCGGVGDGVSSLGYCGARAGGKKRKRTHELLWSPRRREANAVWEYKGSTCCCGWEPLAVLELGCVP
eukprot:scaffold268448_cov15-Tisochrysis_lutea.AAC.1